MDSSEKKRIANEKRLKAIKEWQKNRNQVVKISSESLNVKGNVAQNKKTVYNSDEETPDKSNQLKLFDSDEDNDSEDFGDCFKIRPQFEGRNGQRMLEMSSDLSGRFKLDERFREEDEEETSVNDKNTEDSEKDKNIRILESILGREVSKKHPIAQTEKRKIMHGRFDPDNDNNESCARDMENVPKKLKTRKKKTEVKVPPEEIPISTERYIEVTSNLKDIMNTAGSFSFSDKFNRMIDSKDNKYDRSMNHINLIAEKDTSITPKTSMEFNKNSSKSVINNFEFGSSFKDSFFISNSDERLEEGVEFFMRTKPLDQIREEWAKKRDNVLDIFKKRRKSAIRGFSRQPKKKSQSNKVTTKK